MPGRALAVALAISSAIFAAEGQARPSPKFVNGAMIYQIWMRTFTPEGTLQTAQARIPYLAELGATIVYLCPIMRQSTLGGFTNPYRISDYNAIDAEYGTEADLRAFVETAHHHGLKVMLDIVYYHMALDNVLMKTPGFYLQGPDGKPLLGTWGIPRPNYENPKLRQYLIDSLVRWVRDFGVDGFRCDVAGLVPLDFWEQAREELDRVNRDAVLLAEADVPEHQRKAFDISYNFPYYNALVAVVRDGEPASRIRAQWEKARAAFPAGARFLHYSDNHDQERADVVFGQKGALATSVLNFTLDGVPLLYNGQEIGDTTPRVHDRPFPWKKASECQDAIRWELGKPRIANGMCRHRLLSDLQAERLAFHKRLFALRRQEAALTTGEAVWLQNSNPASLVSFLRRKEAEEILVVVNLSNRRLTAQVDLPGDEAAGPWRNLMPGQPAEPVTSRTGRHLSLTLGSYGFVVERRLRERW